jgi:hypothetical protein
MRAIATKLLICAGCLCWAYGLRVDVDYPGFGAILIDGNRFEHDVVVDAGRARRRQKGPSKAYRVRYGHTPLSPDEDIPWSPTRLVVGTGASGQLPIMPEVWEEAKARGVELIALPTAEACLLLGSVDKSEVHAILHVTC